MIRRKLLTVALATTLALSSSVLAFADDQTISDVAGLASGQAVTVNSEVKDPTIEVTVPSSAKVVINPYKATYEDENSEQQNKQVVTAAQTITNNSDVGVAVNVEELKAVPSEGVTISATSVGGAKSSVTTKSAFLYLEMVGGKSDKTDFAAAYDAKSANQLVIPGIKADDSKTQPASKDSMVILGSKTETGKNTAKFQITGDVVAIPTKVDTDTKKTVKDLWGTSDTINVTFKLTFTPQVAETTSASSN